MALTSSRAAKDKMEQTVLILIILAGVLLIPLVPAFVLYWMLPAEASVVGPLKGLNVNLQGAFAGYFALFLVAAGLVQVWKPADSGRPDYQEYLLLGTVELNGTGAEQLDARKLRIFLHPRSDRVEGPIGRNVFEWAMRLPVRRAENGSIAWPYEQLVVEYPDYYTGQVNMGSGKIEADANKVQFDKVVLNPKREDLPPAQEVELTDGN
jgi:hypothetical protein